MTQDLEKQIAREAQRLPPLPEVVNRVLSLTASPKASAQEVARIISTDQVMAGKVLCLANSAYYGLPRQISSVQQAVMVLGFGDLRQMLLAAGVHGLTQGSVSGYFMANGELWRHSMATAVAAGILAKRVGLSQEEAFTAGLMHDIGKLILAKFLGARYEQIIQLTRGEHKSFIEGERQLFNTDHARVGGTVASAWNLPPQLARAISDHHTPLQAGEEGLLVCVTHIADGLSLSLGQGLGLDGLDYVFYPEAVARIGLRDEDLEVVWLEMADLCQKGFDF